MDAHDFLVALTIVLGVAALTTVLCQRLHQPVVLGYIVAGLLIGPHVPFPLVANREIVETLSELGVILLMFSLGLEFSLGKLVKLGPTAGLTALLQSSLMIWLGFVTGRLFGWTVLESLFTGAVIAAGAPTRAIVESGSSRPIVNISRITPSSESTCTRSAFTTSGTGTCGPISIPAST